MSDYTRKADLPSALDNGKLVVDSKANFFRKDPRCPTSFVIGETSFVTKDNYDAVDIGEPSTKNTDHYAYEETVSDIGGGVLKITTRYAAVPETWYSFESLNIPYLKFRGVSVLTAGSITLNTAYLFSFLNVQSSADLKFFNEDGFTSVEEKSGTINVACRVKNEYVLLEGTDIKSGNIPNTMEFAVETGSNIFGDGKFNCGYFMRSDDPQTNEAIDKETEFTFSTSEPSPKVKIESGVYAGNIYFKKTYQIVANVEI